MTNSKIIKINENKKNNKIGVTFSAFDFIHPGHILMLEDCKKKCDYLIVGIQINPSNKQDLIYRKNTGLKNKPIYNIDERIIMIKGIKFIDAYFTYETEKDLYDFLRDKKYDIRIIGSDWKNKKFTGYDINKAEIYFHKRNHNLSSTEIKRRLLKSGNLIKKQI